MNQDRDPAETLEWLDALDSDEAFEGIDRVDELLDGIVQAARRKGAKLPFATDTGTTVVLCPIFRTGSDDLFHFSATSADGHHDALRYHEQIQADCSGIWGYFGWHAKCTS